MILAIRRVLAVLAACGLVTSAFVYIGSYVGMTMDGLFRWAFVLHVGVFILLLPMFALEYSALNARTFFWKGFAEAMPKWVVPTIKLLGVFFTIHFLLFLIQSHAASPQIKSGEYVLDNHGQIVKVLTQREYLGLKGAELRLFATGWMFFYFVPAAYWWFPRNRERLTADASLGKSTG
ncbi:MAG: hypothetical protein WCF22_07060 [Candidatus Sulfotelmatobacter sp.]